MFDKGFLFPHTIPTFSGPQKDSFENIVEKVENAGMICFAFGWDRNMEKGRKCWLPAFNPLPDDKF